MKDSVTHTQIGFVLGRDTTICIAEVFAYLIRLNIAPKSQELIGSVLLLDFEFADAAKIHIDSLGGTIKIFTVLGNYEDAEAISAKLLSEVPSQGEKRVNFGISGYGNVNKDFVQKIGYDIKKSLTDTGHAARFVTSKSVDLSSVIVHENKLIERGFEAIIIKTGQGLILGKTISVQDYKAYSKRDFGRPKRDDRNGMLPPKLAQILINLTATPQSGKLYDPFCGSGTVLQEALFFGYRDIYGSDIEINNILDTKENLEWLYRAYGMPKVAEDHVFVSDVLSPLSSLVTNPGISSGPSEGDPRVRKDDKNAGNDVDEDSRLRGNDKLFDAIVGEGFLGEPVRRRRDQALTDLTDLSQFYIKALANLKTRLKNDGTIVLAIPFFIVDKEYFYLPILKEIPEIGLKLVNYTPKDLKVSHYGRGNLTYSRPDQFVGREILILKKSS